jgi:formate hydrogenlyase subunit 4
MILDVSIYKLLFLILAVPISLFFEGVRRKLLARMQNRIGPPVWQPFYDVLKLIEKGESNSKASESIFFRTIPILYFVTTFALFLFVPFPIISFRFDFIMFIYVLILSSAFYVLVGVASNSPFGLFGSMRETVLMLCYEIILAITILTFVLFANVQSLADFDETFMLLRLPIASACLFIIALLVSRMTPFDTVEAPTEIVGSVETEYSGKDLALLEISKNLKFTFFIFLTTMLFFGFQDSLYFFITSLGMLFVFTFTQATTCRYRMDQVFRILIIVLFFAVVEMIRINYIVW